MAELDTTIEESAKSPKKASGDEGSVEMHSISDLIAADNHLANKAATKGGKSAFSKCIMAKASFPGTA